jgi:hypothetical protein
MSKLVKLLNRPNLAAGLDLAGTLAFCAVLQRLEVSDLLVGFIAGIGLCAALTAWLTPRRQPPGRSKPPAFIRLFLKKRPLTPPPPQANEAP